LSVMFLMLDRLFMILWPVGYRTYHRELAYFNIFTCFMIFCFNTLILLITEFPIDERTSENFRGT
jgi:hypothetical protein